MGGSRRKEEQEAAGSDACPVPPKSLYPDSANREDFAQTHARVLLLNCRAHPSHERLVQTSQVASDDESFS